MRSYLVPFFLLVTCLCLGLFASIVTANSGCDDAQSTSQPCAEQEQSVMLPLIMKNVAQEVETTPTPADTATLVPTTESTAKPTVEATATPASVLTAESTAMSTAEPAPSDVPNSTSTPVPSATSNPLATLEPSVTPDATATPEPSAMPDPSATPSSSIMFDPPEISEITQDGNGLRLSWSGCGEATSYRVLYGLTGARTSAIETNTRTVTTPALSANGTYQAIVECYDAKGNSIFGEPQLLEVAQ